MCFPKLCEFKCFWCIKQKAGVSTYTHTKLLLRTAMEINKVIAFYTMCVFFKILELVKTPALLPIHDKHVP